MKQKYPNLSALTREKSTFIISEADFTELQRILFNELKKDTLNDKGIMLKYNIPKKKFYLNKKIVYDKIFEIYPQFKIDPK